MDHLPLTRINECDFIQSGWVLKCSTDGATLWFVPSPSWCEIFMLDSFRNMFLTTKICKLPFARQTRLLRPQQLLTSFNIYIFLCHQNVPDWTNKELISRRALALVFKRKQFLILKLSEVLLFGLLLRNFKHLQALVTVDAQCWGSRSFKILVLPLLSF